MKKFLIIVLILFSQSCKEIDSEQVESLITVIGISEIFINQKVDNQDISRKVIIHGPKDIIENKKYPVVFYLHGNGGLPTRGFILSELVDSGEFIGVYPEGYKRSWNLGAGIESSNANDVEFIKMIVSELSNYSNIDLEKVYAIGNSNGSAMANQLALKTNIFKGIAPLASQLLLAQNPITSTKPLSVYQICGSHDETIPYEGGLSSVGHIFKSSHESAYSWASAFNCNLNAEVQIINSDSIFTYNNCKDGNIIKFQRVENGNHGLNGNLRDKCNKIWEFFKQIS